MSGKTRVGEPIVNGIVSNVFDGSIDELLASRLIFKNGKVVPGPSSNLPTNASSVIVVETPTVGVSLQDRVFAHSQIILNYD